MRKIVEHIGPGVMMTMAGIALTASGASAAPKGKLPPIYDTQADGTKQIEEALAIARRDHKRVLLQFGANWCVWCHRLHHVFDTNAPVAEMLRNWYVLTLIDVDEIDGGRHNADVVERYGNPIKHGLPTIVVLDAKGRQLTTQETSAWEVGDGYDLDRVLAFLDQWEPAPLSAEKALSDALAEARSGSKQVFVYFSAPWCGFCQLMKAYLRDAEVSPVFTKAFVPVEIDIDRMSGGKAIAEKYGKAENEGIPFWVVLDPSGKVLADSRGPQGNVGFPVEPHEVEHFVKTIRQVAEGLKAEDLALLKTALARFMMAAPGSRNSP